MQSYQFESMVGDSTCTQHENDTDSEEYNEDMGQNDTYAEPTIRLVSGCIDSSFQISVLLYF